MLSRSSFFLASRLILRFYLMGHATKLCYNPDAKYCQSYRSKFRQNNWIELLPYQVFCQLSPIVNALKQYWYYQFLSQWSQINIKKLCFAISSMPCIFSLIMEVSYGLASTLQRRITFSQRKYHLRLVLFCRPLSIARLYGVIWISTNPDKKRLSFNKQDASESESKL